MFYSIFTSESSSARDAPLERECELRDAHCPAMLHWSDADDRLFRVSDAWLAKLEYQRAEVIGRRFVDFLTAESRDRAASEVYPGLMARGRCENIELRMTTKNGRAIDVLLSAALDGAASGAGRVLLGVITDVTAQMEASRRLAADEARYRALVEDQSEMVSLATPEGILLYVNLAYARLHERDPDELVGKSLYDFVPPASRSAVAAHLGRVIGEGLIAEIENQIALPSGRTRWTSWMNRAVAGSTRGSTLIHSVGRDIEDRVETEQRLRESEARYRFLTENSSDMILLLDDAGRRLHASPACRALLGYEPEEMLEISMRDSIHPEDVDRISTILANGEVERHLTYRMRRKDGGYVWVETAGTRVRAYGPSSHRLVVVRNVEQRIAAERSLRESEARYRLLADNSRDMVIQLDSKLARQYVSPACRELFGYEPDELIGAKSGEMAHPEDAPRLTSALKSLLDGRVDQESVVSRRRHRDGRWIWVETQYRSLKDPRTGEITGVIGAVRDISSRKAIEDELAEANRRLALLAARDGLTGLANRRAFDDALATEFRQAKRENKSLALIMIDVDSFKAFNDQHGHPAGDECLRRIGQALMKAIHRPGDFVARYGGEEFAVLLPDADETAGAAIAERIRRTVLRMAIRHDASSFHMVTVSLGVASLEASVSGADGERLLQLADRALYRAKENGRNTLARASSLEPDLNRRERPSRRRRV
jgi:diguanylate cyclase (GGDEF)-like protein/PAS domain S-box-containing protein